MPLPLVIGGLWAGLGAFLATVIVPLTWRVLAALGLGFVTITGLTFLTDNLRQMVETEINGLPLMVIQFLGLIKADIGFTIILSSLIIRGIMGTASAAAGMSIKKAKWNTGYGSVQ